MLALRLPAAHKLERYVTVGAIVLVVGGLFVKQQFLDAAPGSAPGVIEGSQRVAIGERAPDFALEEAGTGRLVRLSDYRGKTVVLNFWATWCPPCRAEMPDFQRAYEARQARGDLVVIAVDDREPDALVTDFTKGLGVTFPVLIDRTGDVRVHYGVSGLPGTFFIDRDGVLRSQSFGPVTGDPLFGGIALADGRASGSGTPAPGGGSNNSGGDYSY